MVETHEKLEHKRKRYERDGELKNSRTSENDEDDSSSSSSSSSKHEHESRRKHGRSKRRRRSRPRHRDSSSEESTGQSSSESEEEECRHSRRRHKREEEREKKREEEREKKREKKRRLKEQKRKEEKRRRKKEKAERHKKGPVTATWGKYGLIKDIDMWSKRPEFSAWLAEVKKVNLESLPNWEEKQMFKQYMEDYNTATLPSKKYYNIDKYYHGKMLKAMNKGRGRAAVERTEFNDEEQRRQEIRMAREQQKETQLEEMKLSMTASMAQAMREQAQLREEMQYQFRLGNTEAANAIQRRLDPDAAIGK